MTKLPADAKVELVENLLWSNLDLNGHTPDGVKRTANRIVAALEQSDAEQGEDAWQPIETAPRDGRWLLVYSDRADRDTKGYFGLERWLADMWCDSEEQSCGPTHWMPLPEPPTPQVDKG
jgi:hypothetical protein